MKRTIFLALLVALVVAEPVRGAWREVYVVDARLAVLRAGPSLTVPLARRLRVGRRVYIVGAARDREGREWLRVAVTRRTRGWILGAAVAGPGREADEGRLAERIAGSTGIERAEVARVAADRFPRLRAVALRALEEVAAEEADGLSERAARRLGALDGVSQEEVRALMLSDPGLDRFNRLGITFDVDVATRRYFARPVRR